MDDLVKLRLEINKVDRQLLRLIKRRIDIVEKIGSIKRRDGLKVRDPKREDTVITNLSAQGEKIGLRSEIIKKIWKTFFKIAYRIEES